MQGKRLTKQTAKQEGQEACFMQLTDNERQTTHEREACEVTSCRVGKNVR